MRTTLVPAIHRRDEEGATSDRVIAETSVTDLWQLFLEEVGKEKPFLLPTLKAGRLEKMETGRNGKTVHLRFRRQFEEGLLKSNQAVLAEIWSRKFASGNILFETAVEEEKKFDETKTRPQAATPQREALNVQSSHLKTEAVEPGHSASASLVPEEEELVRRVLGMFDGEVTSIKKET